ncbi:MAG: low molecular weight phosphotyrosine protein phosphatase [Aphanocapsa sp. GSE-SYN-MK-11-07L]|jgi:protein-tyrosine phosphatase|nr:low molecular weight phosphotyrosine protein phosphatase [Aphanocapsa sp. GSE-SYN-MK-11-07L]
MTTKLLFVCLGNICRSPAAEGMMNHLAKQAGLSDHIECDSAGTSSYHIGSPPDQRMTLAAKQQGIVLQGQARQFQVQDFQAFDLILAMDRQNYRAMLRLDRSGQFQDKVRLICDFCTTYGDQDVPDPYYGGADGFVYVLDLLSDACAGLLKELA